MKVIIWDNFVLKQAGGPSGYLYNLKKFIDLEKKSNINIEFLFKCEDKEENKIKNKIKSIIPTKVSNYFKLFHYFKRIIIQEKISEDKYKKILNSDIIHFHSTYSYYRNLKKLKNYKGKIIVSSHSPQPFYQEIVEDICKFDLKKFPNFFLKLLATPDYIAFEQADYLIFPCKEALEPYINRDENIKRIFIKNKNKIKYYLTGIEKIKINENNDYMKKFQIPNNAVVISYIGRHTKIKGYDLVIRFAKKILEKYDNVFFIIGGNYNEHLDTFKHERFINLGWTKEGKEIIKNSDLFLLPNRETYFDLIFLEVLSMGTPILCSDTGGNKFFKKFNSEDIIYFENENLLDLELKYQEYIFKRSKIRNKFLKNAEIFDQNFDILKSGYKYLDTLKGIYNEK